MRMHFYLSLIVVILPYLATACDIDACKIGASTGLAIGCTAVSTTVGAFTCGVGAAFTFGASCLLGLVAAVAIAGGCAAADGEIDKASTLCGCSEDDISLETTLSKIDQATKLNKEWFETLASNQKTQVLNQITLLRRQKKANSMLTTLIVKTDQVEDQVIKTQIIAQYASYLDTIPKVGRRYNRIPKRKFGLLTKGRTADDFKELALKVGNGLYDSIDLTFQLLLGGRFFHNGESVFQYQNKTYCEESSYTNFLNHITGGIMLYETALIMDNDTLPLPTRKAWAKNFALVAEQYGTHCGCPPGSSLAGTGEVSKLKQNLLEPETSYIDNFRKAVNIQNIFTREKAFRLLVVMNFDINGNALAELETFTIEDIILVAQLLQSNKYDDMADIYENVKVCASYSSNDPSLKFSNLTVRCNPNSTCSGQGTCNQDATCRCNENYYGDNCDVRCIHDFTCNGQGVACYADGSCRCNENYYGDKCEVHCDPKTTCNGGGICINEGTTCQCKQGYIGDKCESCQSGYWRKGDECVKEGCDSNSYHTLTDDTRRSSHTGGIYCDRLDVSAYPSYFKTSRDWKGAGWYKVGHGTGTIATQVVAPNRCNTWTTGYLASESHPEDEGKTSKAKICFSSPLESCFNEMQILIKNCKGFYLYKLEEPGGCRRRFCTN